MWCQHRAVRYLRLVERDEFVAERRRQREETDRGPTDEVGEHEERHPLGDTRVVGAPRLRGTDRAVDLRVAADDDEERDAVEQHQETHKPCKNHKGRSYRKHTNPARITQV